jgi:hypothetical protein
VSDLDVLRELTGQLRPPKYNDLVAVARKRRRRTAATTTVLIAAATALVIVGGATWLPGMTDDSAPRPGDGPAASITERPRSDQWAYVEYYHPGSECEGNCTVRNGGGNDPDDDVVQVDASWLRVDGQSDAYKIEGDDQLYVQNWVNDEYGDWTPTELLDLYASLPRNPDRLLEAIYAELERFNEAKPYNFGLRGDGRYNTAVWLIGKLLGENGLTPPPDLRAPLFETLAKVPGVQVKEDVEDVAGRDAVFVGRVGNSCASCLSGMFLDPEDHTYLGGTENYQGEATEGWAIMDRGIVDHAGDRP